MKPKPEPARQEPITGLLSEPRRRRMLDWIQEEGSARVRELAAAFQVSEATIRQDLERLEQEGQITREHGGAFLNTVPAQVGTMTLHHQENMEQKRRIGAMAADLVKDGETIILDAGTTTTEIALRLVSRRNLTIITNSLTIAILLGAGGAFQGADLFRFGGKSGWVFPQYLCRKAVSGDGGRRP